MADDTTMRGISCAVSRATASGFCISGVALGVDRNAADDRVAISLRHADGTILTGYLSDALLSRLADILIGLGDGPRVSTHCATGTIQ